MPGKSQFAWEGDCSKCGRPARLPFVPRDPKRALCSDCHRQQQQGGSSDMQSRNRPTGGFSKRGLPEGYLRLGYFDSDGYLRKEVMIDEAKEVAESLARSNLAAVKLQGLYNRARMLKDRLNRTDDFRALKADLYGLLTDAVDSTGRRITPDIYREFVERNIGLAVVDSKSFQEGFVEHLRSVRAWFLLARSNN